MSDQPTPIDNPNLTLEAVKTRLLQLYIPTSSYVDADVRMTTNEIYAALQGFCPGMYTTEEISNWLNQWGFCFIEIKPFHFEWIFKKKLDISNG